MHFIRTSCSLTLAAMTAGLLACASNPAEPSPLLLKVEPAKTNYHIGDTIKITLENKSTSSIGFNVCLSTLQKLNGATWSDVVLAGDGLSCGDNQLIVKAGERTGNLPLPLGNSQGTLPSSLMPGTYRVRIPTPVLKKEPNEPLNGDNRLSSAFTIS